MGPRVSIGMPVYNGMPYLQEAIDSILAQTYTDFELIISDNASTDGTEQMCREYACRDGMIYYSRNDQNYGAAYNFNRVFQLSSGEYFKWAATDDALEPIFLAKCVEMLDNDPTLILAYARLKVMDDYYGTGLREGTMRYDKLNLALPSASERLRQMLILLFPTIYPIWGLVRSSVLRQTPLIRPYPGGDNCLLVDLILRGKFGEVPEYLIRGRWSHQSYGGQLVKAIQAGGTEGLPEVQWYNTRAKGRIFLPHWRRFQQYFLSIIYAYEPLGEKIAMIVFLCGAAVGYRERLKAELGNAVRLALSSTPFKPLRNSFALIVETAFILPFIILTMVGRLLGCHKTLLKPSINNNNL